MESAAGEMIAAPSPWKARAPMSDASLHARPARSDDQPGRQWVAAAQCQTRHQDGRNDRGQEPMAPCALGEPDLELGDHEQDGRERPVDGDGGHVRTLDGGAANVISRSADAKIAHSADDAETDAP
jgi:hypothetical protein